MADWLETARGVVFPWHCDHFGHMNARWYAHHFDDASFHLWARVGLGHQVQADRGTSLVVARTAIDFIHELKAGELLVVRSAVVGIGTRSVRSEARMFNDHTGELCARQRAVDVFFDEASRRSAPMPDDIRAQLESHLVAVDEE